MAGKDGAVQPTAVEGASVSGEHVQPPPPVPPPPVISERMISERKLNVVHDEDAPDGKPNSKARAPSHASGKRRGMLDRSLQAQLGRQLRAIFSDVAEEPVPERFVKLLEALEAKEKQR